MTALQNLRKTLSDPTPFYAAVGAADLAVSRVKSAADEAGKKVESLRSQLAPEQLADKAQQTATETVAQVQALPQLVEEQSKAARAQAESSYAGLSKRGADAVAALRQRKETQQVLGQGKAAVKGVRKAADETQSIATKTVLAGRKEAAKQVETAATTVESAATKLGSGAGKVGSDARTEVRSSAARYGAVDAKPATRKTAKKAPAKRTAKKTPAKRTAKKAAAEA